MPCAAKASRPDWRLQVVDDVSLVSTLTFVRKTDAGHRNSPLSRDSTAARLTCSDRAAALIKKCTRVQVLHTTGTLCARAPALQAWHGTCAFQWVGCADVYFPTGAKQ